MNDTTTDPFAMGREAFDAGHPADANPFPGNTDERRHLLWNDGYNAAAEEAAEDGEAEAEGDEE